MSQITDHRSSFTGFSLIEILVAVGLFSVISAVAVQAIFSSLASSRKADVSIDVRENAEAALATIERRIRGARSIVTCGPNMSSIEYVNPDDSVEILVCDMPNSSVTINGDRLTNDAVNVTTCSFSCTEAGPGKPPEIDIALSVQGASRSGAEQASVRFMTKVLLRTY